MKKKKKTFIIKINSVYDLSKSITFLHSFKSFHFKNLTLPGVVYASGSQTVDVYHWSWSSGSSAL